MSVGGIFTDMRECKRKRNAIVAYLASTAMLGLLLVFLMTRPAQAQSAPQIEHYTESEIVKIIANYFGMSAESVAEVVNAIFTEHGEPNAYIKGEEAGAAFGLGIRYGRGEIVMRDGEVAPIYWRGPTAGFDTGADAGKSFTLIYNLDNIADIYKRFPGVEGSAHMIAGVAVNYQRRGKITLAPMRVGIGLRLGANVGYIRYTPEKGFWKF